MNYNIYDWKKEIYNIIEKILNKKYYDLELIPIICYKKYFDNNLTSYEIAVLIILETEEFNKGEFYNEFIIPTLDTVFLVKPLKN